MLKEIVISGFGGQGVLYIGRILAEAGVLEGREVSWLPTYGGEKRGGSCSCYVIISDEQIGNIFISRPSHAIALNPASLKKLEPAMQPGGFLLVNRSLVHDEVKRTDIRHAHVSANEIAIELGDLAVSNLVALGSLLGQAPAVKNKSVLTVLDNMLAKNPAQLKLNRDAFLRGYAG